VERNSDYEIAKQNVTQFPSILWEKFNFFIQTGSTEDYKHSSYCHFDAYHELISQNILLYSCDLVSRRYFGFGRMLRSRREMNSRRDFDKKIKKDSPWSVLSSRAIGRTHAVTSIHVVTLALAVYWDHVVEWIHDVTLTKK
jgi:hypothetical protein